MESGLWTYDCNPNITSNIMTCGWDLSGYLLQ